MMLPLSAFGEAEHALDADVPSTIPAPPPDSGARDQRESGITLADPAKTESPSLTNDGASQLPADHATLRPGPERFDTIPAPPPDEEGPVTIRVPPPTE